MVGDEHHPGVASSPVSASVSSNRPTAASAAAMDRRIGEILAHLIGIGQIVGRIDSGGVGRFVAIPRIGPVGLEEAGRQQKRSAVSWSCSHR